MHLAERQVVLAVVASVAVVWEALAVDWVAWVAWVDLVEVLEDSVESAGLVDWVGSTTAIALVVLEHREISRVRKRFERR
jgi:hypothetical protein